MRFGEYRNGTHAPLILYTARCYRKNSKNWGTPEIITIIVLQLEQLDFNVQYCVQKMQTE